MTVKFDGTIKIGSLELPLSIAGVLVTDNAPEPIPPTPQPSVPTLPVKTNSMILYENWQNTQLDVASSTAPFVMWARANSINGVEQKPSNNDVVSSEIVTLGNAKALKMRLAPTTFPQSTGVRVVWTNQGRWDALQPYANSVLYGRTWLMFPELPQIDEQGGRFGRWLTAGFQIKDDPNGAALFQWNTNQNHEMWLGYRPTAAQRWFAPKWQANHWHQIDFEWFMTSENTGYFIVKVDGNAAYTAMGRSAYTSGFGSFHFALYGDDLRAPATLYAGPIVISRERL